MQRISKIQVELKPELTPASTHSAELTTQTAGSPRRARLRRQLVLLGEARKEHLSAEGLLLYSKALEDEFADDADTAQVFGHLMRTPRRDYEPNIPALPDLLEMVRNVDRDRRRKARELHAVSEVDRLRAQWERERAEDIANGIPRGTAEDELREMCEPGPPKRTLLVGWTAEELRAAADKLERGEEVDVPEVQDTFEARQARAREHARAHGVTREAQLAARDRVLAANRQTTAA